MFGRIGEVRVSVVEAGIPVVASDATACPLCATHATKQPARRADRYETLLPWAAVFGAAIVLASVGIGSDRWFGTGAVAGLIAGATLAILNVRRAVGLARAAHDVTVSELGEEADTRVSMVVRQFEWAITDLAKLKKSQERAQVTADLLVVQGRGRERHIKKLERELADARERMARLAAFANTVQDQRTVLSVDRATDQIPFRWGTHADAESSRLELECDIRQRVTRVRVIDRAGITKVKSSTPMHSGDGALCFALADPPAELLADIDAGREPGYRLQALRDGEWLPLHLEDSGRRTRVVTDKQGRVYRVNDALVSERRAAAFNPFDLTSDGTFFSL